MESTHYFNLDLEWKNHSETLRTFKNHQIRIDGKPILEISAAKAFKGDAKLYNPEDLLLSSLASCLMMSYLYCCSVEKIKILSYQDHAEAILKVYPDGSGKITKVILKPIIIIEDKEQIELAISLHHKANQLCFIANSCNFEVEHQVVVRVDIK